jgi:hypothetical protein
LGSGAKERKLFYSPLSGAVKLIHISLLIINDLHLHFEFEILFFLNLNFLGAKEVMKQIAINSKTIQFNKQQWLSHQKEN